jgi:hypothetical protein
MHPFIGLLIGVVAILTLGYAAGYRIGVLTERHRTPKHLCHRYRCRHTDEDHWNEGPCGVEDCPCAGYLDVS